LDTLSFEEDYLFFSTLRNIHENTAGKVQSRTQPHYFNFFEQTKKHFKAIEHLLTEKQRTRVNEAFERVRVFESSQSGSEKCFVHGDYHPGNILVIDNAVVGLLDTDWARPGYRIEDLAMSLQMFLRDYKKKDFTFDKARFDRCLAAYRLDSTEERTILKEYFILCTVFDFYLTNTVPLFPRDAEVRNFQRKLLSYVCEFF
jgi:aminoglycoside phosphotransferase (APT) family kinase protein